MKKQILFLVVILILILTGCTQKNDEEVTYYISKTMIKQGTGDISLREHTYDENWNPLTASITLNGKFSSMTEYVYSDDYSMVTQNYTSAIYDPSSTTIIRTFDEKGQVIRAETYDGDRHISTAENTYDISGNVILSILSYPESDFATTLSRTYDKNNNLITYHMDTGYMTTRIEYHYDQDDRIIREENYKNNELETYCEYQWQKNTAYITNYSANGTQGSKTKVIYDDVGNVLVNEVTDANGNLHSCSYNEYIGTDGSISSGIPD